MGSYGQIPNEAGVLEPLKSEKYFFSTISNLLLLSETILLFLEELVQSPLIASSPITRQRSEDTRGKINCLIFQFILSDAGIRTWKWNLRMLDKNERK